MNHSRRAVATIWALVVLSILTLLIATISWQVFASRRWLERREHQIQAAWLARSGLELAANRLLLNPAGSAKEPVPLIAEWEVRIELQRDEDSPNIYVVTSEARYPAAGDA